MITSLVVSEEEANPMAVTLYNGNAFVTDKANRYSCWYDKDGNCNTIGPDEKSLIDHVLMSPGNRTHFVTDGL